MRGRVVNGGDRLCASSDLDSCRSLASAGKEGTAHGRKGPWRGESSRESREAELCDFG